MRACRRGATCALMKWKFHNPFRRLMRACRRGATCALVKWKFHNPLRRRAQRLAVRPRPTRRHLDEWRRQSQPPTVRPHYAWEPRPTDARPANSTIGTRSEERRVGEETWCDLRICELEISQSVSTTDARLPTWCDLRTYEMEISQSVSTTDARLPTWCDLRTCEMEIS